VDALFELFGQRHSAPDFVWQVTVNQIRIAILSGLTALGIPQTTALGSLKETQPTAYLCSKVYLHFCDLGPENFLGLTSSKNRKKSAEMQPLLGLSIFIWRVS
jgi:hypothetical protein